MKKTITSILFALLLSSFGNAQINLSGGLIAHYPFQNASLNDSSGNNNHFSAPPNSNHTSATDPWGNPNSAIRLLPSKMPELPANLVQGFPLGFNARTISVWFKLDTMPTVGTTNLNFIFYYGATSTRNAIGIAVGNNQLVGIGYLDDLTANVNITTNTWHHVLLSYNNVLAQLYFDGTSVSTGRKVWNTLVGNGRLGFFDFVSSTPPGGNLPVITYRNVFRGDLDELRIYDRVLSQAEISALSNNSTVGIEERTNQEKLKLFPNPVGNNLNLSGKTLRDTRLITIYNSGGHLVKQVDVRAGSINQNISLEGLPNGVYMLKVNNHQRMYKILKTN